MKVRPVTTVIQPGVREMMIKKIIYILLCLVLFRPVFGQNPKISPPSIRVKYISAQHVYLDAGRAAGLNTGDHLEVIKNGQSIAEIEIVYLSENSASCKIISSSRTVEAGDEVILIRPDTRTIQAIDTSSNEIPQVPSPEKTEERSLPAKKHRSPFSGNFAFQYYYWDDQKGTNLNFSQPTLRLNLRGQNLWGRNFHLRIRGRLRHNKRSVELNPNAPLAEWRNRIFELSFSYDNPLAIFNFRAGRIISNQFSGVGYIDGLLLQYNRSQKFHLGAFGGTQPQWQYSDFQTSIQKYGGFLTATLGDMNSGRFETTLAVVGEYHGRTVSREFIYLQNSFYQSNHWSFYQSAEIDLNRKWRKNITDEEISLTSFFLSGQWNVTHWMVLGAMYDNRKNYLTYETRSLADSLFDEAMRQGMRGNLTIILPQDFRIFGNFGMRKRETDTESTISYAAGLGKTNFIIPYSRISLNSSGFSNFYSRGFYYSLLWGHFLWKKVNTDLSYGGYQYDLKADNRQRINRWIRWTFFTPLICRLYCSGQYEYQWGDDLTGHRILGEIGIRF